LLTGLQVDPRERTFVFNATDGQIQFYNANEDRSVRKLQVASKNPLNYFRYTHIADHVVQSIAFSKRGEWLVSVDKSPANSANTTLKFWLYDERLRRYELNTQINDPHTDDITGLCYNPASDMCVTSSTDGKFKVWVLVERQPEESDEDTENTERDAAVGGGDINNNKSQQRATRGRRSTEADMCWACKSVGFYRDLPATAVSMSSDGSILAVAYSHIITLWNPVTNSLISTLTCAVPNEQITKLAFLNSAPFLVACSDYRLYVWDLLTCQVAWSHVVPAKLLTVDTVTSRFAIYAPHRGPVPERGTIILWDPTSPKPLLLTRTQGGFIKGLCFAPPSPVATAPVNQASTSNAKAGAGNKALAPLASAKPALVYMDKSNHMICLENISSEQKFALLRKHKKRQQQSTSSNSSSTSNTAAGLTAEIQAPAAMLKDSFHRQMVRIVTVLLLGSLL
jgi:NET1-associated nuclear protein 1 (U3 small nucleolar RNA-associated protein 17)